MNVDTATHISVIDNFALFSFCINDDNTNNGNNTDTSVFKIQ